MKTVRTFYFLLSMVLLVFWPSSIFAYRTNMGTINIEVGQEVQVYAEKYLTASGNWSKTGNCFYISAKSQTSCKIYGLQAGTAELKWEGVIGATDYDMYWTINVTDPNSGGNAGGGSGDSGGSSGDGNSDNTTSENWTTNGNYDISWYDKNKIEFSISTAKELAGFAYIVNNGYDNFAGKTIILSSNIDLSGKNWQTVGIQSSFVGGSNYFKGTFDGQNFIISGLNITKHNTNQIYYGFFGYVYGGAIIDLELRGTMNIDNSDSNSSSKKRNYVGSLIGYAESCNIENCKSSVTVNYSRNVQNDAKIDEIYVGGLAGYFEPGSNTALTKSAYYGNISCKQLPTSAGYYMTGSSYIGGLVGKYVSIYSSPKMEYCESDVCISVEHPYATMTCVAPQVAGLVAYGSSTIRFCRTICSININHHGFPNYDMTSGLKFYTGGICAKTGATIINCYAIVKDVTVSNNRSDWKLIYYGIGGSESSNRSVYSNSDVTINTSLPISKELMGDTYTSDIMKTSDFLNELNTYSKLELGEEVWMLKNNPSNEREQYPSLVALNANSDISVTNIDITSTNFPDDNFRNWILEQDYGKDGKLTEDEIKNITSISVNEKNISTLKGIEFFTSLDYLNCSYNQLTSLDVSKNTALIGLYCYDNQLTVLDVSQNIALTTLSCASNQLTSLDVSKNTALTYLHCASNQLTSLDISKNTALTELYCYRNQIKEKAMDELISSLPYNSSDNIYKFYVISTTDDEGNVCTKSQVKAVKAKGWTPYYGVGYYWQEYEGSEDPNAGDEDKPQKGDPILITHIADSYDIIDEEYYDISEYHAMKLDGIINEYMADGNRGENQEFYLEGGKNYYISSNVDVYKGLTIRTNPADIAAGKGRAKFYLSGICKKMDANVKTAYFILGRQPKEGENEAMTLDIDSVRFIDLDFDVPLATNYGHQQEGLGASTTNYFMNMYSNGLGVNLTTLEWRNCSFQGLIRGFLRIQGHNDKNIHHIRMIGCDFYNCGYFSQSGADYAYIFGDHNNKPSSNILEDVEVAECVFYNNPKRAIVTDNSRNLDWDKSVRWHINLHHNTFVNFSTAGSNPILNTRYIPGGSILECHDNVIILTKDIADVNRAINSSGWDARYIQGGDGSGQATFNIYNNWTTNDEEYLVNGQPFTNYAFNSTTNAPGKFITSGVGIYPHGTEELTVHLERNLRATDLMISPNPKNFIGETPTGKDYYTDNGIGGLYYKQIPLVLNSDIYKSGAGAPKLRNYVSHNQGDVNMDNAVNGTDLVALSNIVLGRKEKTETADVNKDGNVNGTDIVALSNIILGRSNKASRRTSASGASLSIKDFDIKAGETKEMLIDLSNPNDEVTLVQFDMHLPAGLSIKKSGSDLDFDMAGRTSWRKHTLDANEVDGAYRFLLYSSGNTLIEGTSGAIIKVNIVADESFNGGKIMLDNILLVDPNEKETKPESYEYVIPTPDDGSAKLSIEPFDIAVGETKEMLIDLLNPNDEVTLVQFDLHLPAGLSIKKNGSDLDFDMAGRTSWRKHTLDANEVDGAYRFLLYSSGNTLIEGTSGAIIKVNLVADESFNGGKIVLDNILLVDPNEKETKPANYEYVIGSGSGISTVMMDASGENTRIYNLSGQKLTAPKKGVNIINGKKIVIR